MQTIIRGTRFLLCDDRGDVADVAHGLFADDTRRLSTWRLLVDGAAPQPLGDPRGCHATRTFVQRNVASAALSADEVLVVRRVVVGRDALHERLELRAIGARPIEFGVRMAVACDFADVFTVKEFAFGASGDDAGEVAQTREIGLRGAAPEASSDDHRSLVLAGGDARCDIAASVPFEHEVGALRWTLALEPGETWTCDLRAGWSDRELDGALQPAEFDGCFARAEQRRAAWAAHNPALSAPDPALTQLWQTSVADLGALQVDAGLGEDTMLTAAGMPWFMTVFGRDSLVTCLQTMVLGAGRARSVLRYLAARQCTADDPSRDGERGKVLHEIRAGAIAGRGYDLYYGTVDATPLFLVLLHEVHRWTGDDDLVRELWQPALLAIEWLRGGGDLDDDGYIEYQRRAPGGLDNQGWKDSWDSQRHRDGSLAIGPVAPLEAQAYAWDALRRVAELASTVIGDASLGEELAAWAADLRARFNEDFWVDPATVGAHALSHEDPRADGYFAMALDGEKRQLATLTSNIGHVLWSGVADRRRAAITARQLAHPVLSSGWGVRTMALDERSYNPISYHNGTVWPHDTSIAVAGLARSGSPEAAAQLGRALVDAAPWFDGRLPEAFAGVARTDVDYPVHYPMSSSPQSWAAGAGVLVVAALLGLEPDVESGTLTSTAAWVPDWLNGVRIEGIEVHGGRFDVAVVDGSVVVTPGRVAALQ